MKSDRIIFLFEGKEQADITDAGYLWNGYRDVGNCRSLLKIIEEDSDSLRKQFKILIAEALGDFANKEINKRNQKLLSLLLWSSGLVEQGTLKSSAWLDSLRLLAFQQELLKSDCQTLIYRGSSRLVNESLKTISNDKSISYHWEKTNLNKNTLSLPKHLWRKIPLVIRGFIYFCSYLLKRWPLRKLAEPKWFTEKNSVFFFSYFIHLDPKSGAKGEFYSRQWEQLPKKLQGQGYRLNWLHLFLTSPVIPDVQVGRSWIANFESDPVQQGHHALWDRYLDWVIVARVVQDWCLSICFYITAGKYLYQHLPEDKGWIWPILRIDWKDTWIGPVAVQNLLWIHLFDKALESLPRQRLGLYLQENQGWERIFLYFWRKHKHSKIIGVPHSIIRYWDLRYFDTELAQAIPDLPQPDIIAVNGPHAWHMLETYGFSMEHCKAAEALRYQYLQRLDLPTREDYNLDKLKILVIGDYIDSTTNRMLNSLQEIICKLENVGRLWIKLHPAKSIDLKNYPQLAAELKTDQIFELLSEVDVVIGSVVTAATLEIYCSDIPLISYLDPCDFNSSSLRTHPVARFATTSEEIQSLLQDEEWLSTPSGAKPSDFFWLDEELPRWAQLIQSIFAENSEVNEQCSN